MSPLDQLCAIYGIHQEYYTICGHHHPTSERAKRAILACMDVAAEDKAAVARSLREHERRTWTRLLPPVVVAREHSGPLRLALSIPAALDQRACRWRLRTELV